MWQIVKERVIARSRLCGIVAIFLGSPRRLSRFIGAMTIKKSLSLGKINSQKSFPHFF